MALLKIARLGHPVLLRRAQPVADPTEPEMRRLVADMAETMFDANGLGIAAPQVHVPLRVFVVRDGANGSRAFFNPEIEPLPPAEGVEDEVGAWEGCLSIPGLRGYVSRPSRIAWKAQDSEGEWMQGVAEDMLARVMQHEFDHLEGVLYPSRMEDMSLLGFTDELARAARSGEGIGPVAAEAAPGTVAEAAPPGEIAASSAE